MKKTSDELVPGEYVLRVGQHRADFTIIAKLQLAFPASDQRWFLVIEGCRTWKWFAWIDDDIEVL